MKKDYLFDAKIIFMILRSYLPVSYTHLDLLEETGVDSVKELSLRNADNLYEKIVEINNLSKYVRKLPTLSMVKDWVEQAKILSKEINNDYKEYYEKDFAQKAAREESQSIKKRPASNLFLGIFGGLFILILLIQLLTIRGAALVRATGILLLIFGIIFILFFVILYVINSKNNKSRAKGFLKSIYVSGTAIFIALLMTIIPPVNNATDISETTPSIEKMCIRDRIF